MLIRVREHLRELISIKRNHQFNLGFFFKWPFPFSHIQRLFQGSFIFGDATFSHFFILTTLAQQSLFRTNYFFRAAAFLGEFRFRNSHFTTAVIFSKCLLFRSETSTEQSLIKNGKFFKAFTFRNSYFFGKEIVQNKDTYRMASFSKQVLLQSIAFSQELHFRKS